MSHTPHQLAEDSPDPADQIHALKTTDAYFAKLASEYHEVNRAGHRAETDVEPIRPPHEEDLRTRRMVLKDELYGLLKSSG
ncbi:MAG: DUF465 domain-containing protein [Pseudomonadota bacterium]